MHIVNWNRLHLRPALLLLSLIAVALNCSAHPMGNFSVNHYSRITLSQGRVKVLYLIDMAEIPTFQEMRKSSLTTADEDPITASYLAEQAQAMKEGLSLQIDGRSVELIPTGRRIAFANGAGGLPTMKIELNLEAKLGKVAGVGSLSYVDRNFLGRAGWKEIVVLEDGVNIVDSSASRIDRSQQLTNYSSDAFNSPPQQLSAFVTFKQAVPAQLTNRSVRQLDAVPRWSKANATDLTKKSNGQNEEPLSGKVSHPITKPAIPPKRAVAASTFARQSSPASATTTPRSRFTELISTRQTISLWILLSAGLISAGLGALHALEPGHGKTIVAAYLVGSRGTARHAVLLGLVVTAAHTAGVFALGIVTLYASRYIVPDHLYPWLGAISGLSVAALGTFTFLRHLTGYLGGHSHGAGGRHSHFSMFARTATVRSENTRSMEEVNESATTEAASRSMSLRELCLLGISGGIVPCPAALVVLLSAFSLHRIGFGLFLISAFSAGLALVLVTIGIVMVFGRRLFSTRVTVSSRLARYLPCVSSGFMALLGFGITVSAIASLNIVPVAIAKGTLLPFLTVVSLGILLGMRHSTDADHVVAISTIVSRQRSLKGSATIGLLWGLGHTITIFLVGTAVIIFGVVIPPRLGLSMEFCVALMLILLGVLNISGALRWITERLTQMNIRTNGRGNLDEGLLKVQVTSNVIPSQTIWCDLKRALSRIGFYQAARPLVVGLIHGLAGSAAIALLVLSTIKSPLWATAYLLVFGFGTMAGMMVMTSAISIPLIYTKTRFSKITSHLAVISGFFSLGFGTFLVYHIGFIDGLFTSHIHWIPQ